MKKNTSSLATNTFFLYLMTFSNYVFGFITLPYQTRVLGPDVFGILGFAMAFYTYFMLFLDFGFILNGTKIVAENAGSKRKLGQIFSSITAAKLILFVFACLILLSIATFVELIRQRFLVIFLYLVLAFLANLTPDYIYRGLEKMKIITIRTVLIKMIFCFLIFVFLKKPEQYCMVPGFQIIGNLIAILWVFYDLKKNLGIVFERIKISESVKMLKSSVPFFVSRIASTIYSVTNTVILGFLYPIGEIVGLFTSADKFKGVAMQACSPIADSFYPYMIRTKDYSKMFKVVILFEAIVIPICVVAFIYANDICRIAFGNEFVGAGLYLRYMIPICAIILPSYMFGFPALTAIGQVKWANYSVELAMTTQLIGLVALYFMGSLNAESICLLTIFSEYTCLASRLIVFFIKK